MASQLASSPSLAFRDISFTSTHRGSLRLFPERSSNHCLLILRHPSARRSCSAVVFSRRRKSPAFVGQTKISKSKRSQGRDDTAGDEADEDAFEALFSQLEEDLKDNEALQDGELDEDDCDDEIGEDELARLAQELDEALHDEELDEDLETEALELDSMNVSDVENDKEQPPKLKNWQLRRLAHALKIGRRKISIKALSAELGFERAHVLKLLREPPPNLLMMCSLLPEEVTETCEPISKQVDPPTVSEIGVSKTVPKAEVPVHVMQTSWSMQKRLKKVQLDTLEIVYARTKRPTNAMISSIVHVTNLPWKKVVKWFEDKRLEDGVPTHREPFRRVLHEDMSR